MIDGPIQPQGFTTSGDVPQRTYTQAELDAAVELRTKEAAAVIDTCYRQYDGWARQSDVEKAIRTLFGTSGTAALEARYKEIDKAATEAAWNNFTVEYGAFLLNHGMRLELTTTGALEAHDAELHQFYQSGEAWTRHEAALADKVKQAVLAETRLINNYRLSDMFPEWLSNRAAASQTPSVASERE